MLSREQIIKSLRDKVTHPATPRELVKILKVAREERATFRRLLKTLVVGPWIRLTKKRRVGLIALKPNRDIPYLNDCFEAGKLVPVIDGPYRLADAREAFRRFGSGNYLGKIVITID